MSPTNHEARTANPAEQAWADAYSYKAEIEARDAERGLPHQMPVLTMALLLIFSVTLLIVQCVFLPEMQ